MAIKESTGRLEKSLLEGVVRDALDFPIPLVALEDDVTRGQPLGRLHDPRHPDRTPLAIEASRPGTIICHRTLPMTRPGDCLYLIAEDMDAA